MLTETVIATAAALLIVCAGASCDRWTAVRHPFLDIPPSQRVSALETYPPRERVDTYVAVLGAPPDLVLEDALARGGADIVPAIRERLETETDEHVQLRLIEVLATMEEEAYYDVRSDNETLSVVERATAAMSDRYDGESAQLALATIMNGPITSGGGPAAAP